MINPADFEITDGMNRKITENVNILVADFISICSLAHVLSSYLVSSFSIFENLA